MASKYDFDVDVSDLEIKSNELEIINLWDNLPDYCKTPQALAKVKDMAGQSLWNKLTAHDSFSNCG